LKKKVKFPSLVGLSLTSANSREKVKIAVLSNCKDDYDQETKVRLTQSTLRDIVYPEVLERARNGSLPPDFRLRMAHVLMYAEQSGNEVLLNDDVRFLAHVSLSEKKQIKQKHQVAVADADIKDILGLYPSKKNNPNAAHIMLLKFRGSWHHACNLVYNIELVKKMFKQSTEFFETAKDSLDRKRWGASVDNLYSSTELGIQSLLLLMHQGKFSIHQDHDSTNKLFAGYITNSNLDPKYADHFSELRKLGRKGRYLRGIHDKEFAVEQSEIMKRFSLTKELIIYVKNLLHSRHISRNPPDGFIIALGKG
jgi:hypothetical protein